MAETIKDHAAIRDGAVAAARDGLKCIDGDSYKEALERFHESSEIFERLARDGGVESVTDLAQTQYYAGEVLFRLMQYEESVASNDAAINNYRKAVEAGATQYRIDIAYALSTKADALFQLNRFDEALKTVDESIRLYRELMSANPYPEMRKDAARVINHRGKILFRLGRIRESAETCQQAAELRDSVGNGLTTDHRQGQGG